MQEKLQEQVKSFSEEKFKSIAEKNSCTVEFAAGFVEGESRRRNAEPAPRVALIGIDQYALGFRAGFFERKAQDASRGMRLESSLVGPRLRLQA